MTEHEILVRLRKAGILTPRQSLAWELKRRGLGVAQISRLLGVDNKTVRKLLLRVVNKLSKTANTVITDNQTLTSEVNRANDGWQIPMPYLWDFASLPDEVFPGLFQSGIPNVAKAKEYGITYVVNVSGMTSSITEDEDIQLVNYTMYDSSALPDMRVLLPIAMHAAEKLRQGHKVLVHCHMGLNRSGLMNSLIIWLLTGDMGVKIVRRLQSNRQWSLCNKVFEYFVASLPERDMSSMWNMSNPFSYLLSLLPEAKYRSPWTTYVQEWE